MQVESFVSGCQIAEVIEAAHIKPYRRTFDNSIGNGLLLRADLHKLFDSQLLGVDPKTLKIKISSELVDSEYETFDGAMLKTGNLELIDKSNLSLR